MKQPKCACLHPDPIACLEARSPGVNFEPEDHRTKPFERCECGCHSEDEDGMTGWDGEPAKETGALSGLYVAGHYAHFDGMAWPLTTDPDLEWTLRYGKPTRSQLLVAASIFSAYRQLIHNTRQERDEVIRQLRKAEKAGPTVR